ncbi:MAG: isoleucine--tRNA ligase [Candidatus Falkowbacteria bacterium]
MAEHNSNRPTNQFVEMEHEVLAFWDKAKVFEQSVEREAPKGDYVFYDGPPFATGTPHYGHIVGSLMKDVVPRYWTMQGYRVERKWGWDCHGLPIENIAEKELGFKQKKDILEYGVDKFNELCRSKVLGYVEEWEKVIHRFGRWADMKNSYRTMDLDYMESIWWVFKQLWDKDLIYEGYRSILVCPRCETTLSQMEVSEGYKDIKDLSAIAKFELLDEPGTFVLAWTTTPWTLIGNVALAVGVDIDYVKIEVENIKYILAKARVQDVLKEKEYKIIAEFKGKELVGKKYQPLFDYYAKQDNLEKKENGWQIYAGDFVTTEDGVGVVHIAPAFGEDDLNLGKEYNLPFVQHVGMDGVIKSEAGEFAGMQVKAIDDHTKTDIEIIKYLAHNGLLFHKEKYEHSYPHCWRCETPLINYVTTSWFVNVTKVKDVALENAKEINWSPAHIKEGRFGNWLAGARDWSISRQRFWASVMPIWQCECGERQVFGSVQELKDASGVTVTDLHKHVVDKITVPCKKCNGTMHRIPDVIDTWFDSGSMPYAQMHYPFENKEKFEANFPAEFIAEGIDQTRAWFYYLHILATAIKSKPSFKNVVVNGIVLAEDGKKMAKRDRNYPDPMEVLERHGADAMRCYLASSAVVAAENLNFSEKGVEEALRKNIMILWNVYKFYEMYADQIQNVNQSVESENVLDKWIMARLNQLIEEVIKQMNGYDLPRSVRPITDFINDLSTWYVRRSRDRFKGDDEVDKQAALLTTKKVLVELAKVMAPFMPFVSEQLWQKVTGNNFNTETKSVHLEPWPTFSPVETTVVAQMELAKKVVEAGLAKRDEAGIKIRQPLPYYSTDTGKALPDAYKEIIKDELNILELRFGVNELGTEMTEELKMEGAKRELVRFINAMRKNAGLTIQDRVVVYWNIADADFPQPQVKGVFEQMGETIKRDVLADEIIAEHTMAVDLEKEVKINGEVVWLGIKKC